MNKHPTQIDPTPRMPIVAYLIGLCASFEVDRPKDRYYCELDRTKLTLKDHKDGNVTIALVNKMTGDCGSVAVNRKDLASPHNWYAALEQNESIGELAQVIYSSNISESMEMCGYYKHDCISSIWLGDDLWNSYTYRLLFALSAARFIMSTITKNFDDEFRRTSNPKHPVWLNPHARLVIEHNAGNQKTIIISSVTASKRGANLVLRMGDNPMDNWFYNIVDQLFEHTIQLDISMLDVLTTNVLFLGTDRRDAIRALTKFNDRFRRNMFDTLGDCPYTPDWAYTSLTITDALHALISDIGIDAYTMCDDDGNVCAAHPKVISKHPPIYDRHAFSQAVQFATKLAQPEDDTETTFSSTNYYL